MESKSTIGTDAGDQKKKRNSAKKAGPSKKNKPRIDTAKKFFQDLLEKVKHKDPDLAQEVQSGQYFEIHSVLLQQKTARQETILHLLADFDDEEASDEEAELEEEEEDDYEDVGEEESYGAEEPGDSNPLLKSLVVGLVQKFKDLMLDQDKLKRTPLLSAIESNHESMVTWMLECPNIAEVLEKAADPNGNCVHAAVKSDLPHNIIIELIKKSTKKALCAQDGSGFTPFHLAVEYNRCRPGQLKVVEALIERGSAALDSHTRDPDRWSVYQYHEHTRRKFHAKQTRKGPETDGPKGQRGLKAPESKVMGPPNDPAKESKRASVEGKPKESPQQQKKPFDSKPQDGQDQKDFSVHRPAEENQARTDPMNQERLKCAPAKQEQRQIKGQDMSEASPEAERPKQPSVIAERDVLEHCANQIKETIKLYYLRHREPAKAASWLYDKSVGVVETCFDYIEGEGEVDKEDFEQSYDLFQFDPILQFVHFRKLQLKIAPLEDESLHQDDIDGRWDVKYFFDWLKQKKVGRILRVTVEEYPERPHSDAAIESALEDLQVESLNWQKPDLCPETICRVSDRLKEVYLYWGGNNAVLRAWSEPEGLGRLASLERIHLLYSERLERSSQIMAKITEFRRRMDQVRRVNNLPTVKVLLPKEKGKNREEAVKVFKPTATVPPDEQEQQRKTNKWLDCIDNFSDMLQNIKVERLIEKYCNGLSPPKELQELQKNVVVAVIDDGVSITMPGLRGRIIGGQSFDTSGLWHYRFSAKDHGTLMASQIVRVCPDAKIYAIKVETHPNGKELQIDARSAALAIEAAVNKGVDIISMSWTIPEMAEGSADKLLFDNAMGRAIRNGILLFCSAADDGSFKATSHYPAAFNPNKVFKIGAATASGKIYEWTSSSPSELDYILPGHEVYEKHPKYGPVPESETHSGSSIATALAAGLAALILHCVRLAAIHTLITDPSKVKRRFSVDELRSLKSYKDMKSAFGRFRTNPQSQMRFMEVWHTLGTDFVMDRQWKSREAERLPFIASVASVLLPTTVG